MIRNLKITLEYDGTNYAGWQFQPNQKTIQGELKKAIASINNVPLDNVKITGASRTDAGVHALGQVANFFTSRKIGVINFKKALNSLLSEDIVVKKIEEAPENFNARRDAKGKKYRYIVLNRDYPSALERYRVHYVPYKLNIEQINKALPLFIGKKDFAAFQSSGSDVKTTIREITSFETKKIDDYLIFEIVGSGFLKQMVRNIIGTLLWVGRGKIRIEEIPFIFESKDRRRAGPTAPPHGLYLVEIFY